MSGFFDTMKQAISEGAQASRQIAAKAGAKAQELGEKGVIAVEIKKLEMGVDRLIKKLGLEAYRLFAENGQPSVAADSPEVARVLGEIADLKLQIEQKQAALNEKSAGPL